MGNCCKKESSVHFGGEDWNSATSEKLLPNQESSYGYESSSSMEGEEEGLISKKKENSFPYSSTKNGTEVKIKISKKQLEELVNRANLEGLTIQQLMIQLMDVGDSYELQHHRSWMPALQSIPETELN